MRRSTPANQTAESKANRRNHPDSRARRSACHSRRRNLRSLFRASSWFVRNGFGLRELGDSVTGQSEHRPFLHRFRAELTIKLDRRVVPIEHRPFHRAATPITGNLGKLDTPPGRRTLAPPFGLTE